jgi:hypothetical protein
MIFPLLVMNGTVPLVMLWIRRRRAYRLVEFSFPGISQVSNGGVAVIRRRAE